MSRLIKSSLGSFASRTGLGVTEILGILYAAKVAGAAALGTYALFVAMYTLGLLLVSPGLWEATVKRIAEGESQSEFFTASLLVQSVLFIPVALGIILLWDPIVAYVGTPLAAPVLLMTVFVAMLGETVSSGLHGTQRVGRAEFSLFAAGFAKFLTWLILLWLGFGAVGLLAGLLLSKFVHIAVGMRFLTLGIRTPERAHFESLFKFGRFSWMSSVRKKAWLWTDTLVLGFFVGSTLIGVYELSWRITGAFFIAASALSSTLYANVDRMLRNGGTDSVKNAVSESLVYSGMFAIPGIVGGAVIATPLLTAFGSEYAVGRTVLVLLLAARLFHSYEEIFANVVNALDRPDLIFRANIVFLALNIGGNIVAVATIGWVGAAVATAVSMGVRTALSYYYLQSVMDVALPVREITLEVVAALTMGGLLLLATHGETLGAVETALIIGGGAVVYAVLILVLLGRVRARVKGLVTLFG